MKNSIENKLKKIDDNYSESKNKAEELLKDKEKTKEKINEAFEKASKHKGSLGEAWNYLQLFFSISRDYIGGKYKEIPTGTIISIIAAIIYFVSPIDLIPDFIPGVGLIDDVLIIGLVINSFKVDLEKYEEWKTNQIQ
jgi:uncharacterized membrane protein YkvA (DUF1232 family)